MSRVENPALGAENRREPGATNFMDAGQGGGTQVNRAVLEHICELSEAANVVGDAKFDFDFASANPQHYNRQCLKYLRQFREEYLQISSIIKHIFCLKFEVMCSKESELTRQGLQQGLLVKRFGLEEGDLSTTVGRRNLFCQPAIDQSHLWTMVPMFWSEYEQKRNVSRYNPEKSGRELMADQFD